MEKEKTVFCEEELSLSSLQKRIAEVLKEERELKSVFMVVGTGAEESEPRNLKVITMGSPFEIFQLTSSDRMLKILEKVGIFCIELLLKEIKEKL